MFKHRLNELRLTLQLFPASPLLIKEGRHIENGNKERRFFHHGPIQRTPDKPRLPEGKGFGDYDTPEHCFNMACVYTTTAQGEDRFYLPGSSLRGVMRSTAERLIGRWQPAWVRRSDPFRQEVKEIDRALDGATLYKQCGPIERCFGHTALQGRWVIADAWLQNERDAHVVVRDGVGINRQTGATQQNVKFRFEAIADGIFETTLTLLNYELWQLGLLAHVLAAIDSGEVRIGYGTRRGLGRVRLAVKRMCWRWYGYTPQHDGEQIVIPALATLADRMKLTGYDWHDADLLLRLPLTLDQTAFGKAAFLEPPLNAIEEGFASTDWSTQLWARFGALLPSVLTHWFPEEVPV